LYTLSTLASSRRCSRENDSRKWRRSQSQSASLRSVRDVRDVVRSRRAFCTHRLVLEHKSVTRRVISSSTRGSFGQKSLRGSHGRLVALYPVFSPRVQLYQGVRQHLRYIQITRIPGISVGRPYISETTTSSSWGTCAKHMEGQLYGASRGLQ
jgi:hypothetical protein